MKTSYAMAILAIFSVSMSASALDTNPPSIDNQSVDPTLLQTVQEQLPEASAVDASFLNTDYDPYLTLNQDANISVTFLDEGAGYKNSLGWLTFSEGAFDDLRKGDIDTDNSGNISLVELDAVDGIDTGWLFPNVSESGGGGTLLAGDTVQVGDSILSAGTSVSFFLAQNAWTGGDTVSDGVLEGERQIFYGLDFLNPEADFTSTMESSLVDSRHTALLFSNENHDEVIMGFEDLNRVDGSTNDWNISSDDDFNDAVFIVTSDPADAFGDSNIATAPAPQLGGGLTGILLLVGLGWVSGGIGNQKENSIT
ncbi:MAG: DUF4114 domain-containing protein [Gammaproteobacteria bacterium]|nr:DUF4114 domain-containing protein [Gammaproteobacteria bacterium]